MLLVAAVYIWRLKTKKGWRVNLMLLAFLLELSKSEVTYENLFSCMNENYEMMCWFQDCLVGRIILYEVFFSFCLVVSSNES